MWREQPSSIPPNIFQTMIVTLTHQTRWRPGMCAANLWQSTRNLPGYFLVKLWNYKYLHVKPAEGRRYKNRGVFIDHTSSVTWESFESSCCDSYGDNILPTAAASWSEDSKCNSFVLTPVSQDVIPPLLHDGWLTNNRHTSCISRFSYCHNADMSWWWKTPAAPQQTHPENC